MKIIFSRKGFDSGYGGYPSPILPSGTMVSLPIPSTDVTKYSDLKIGNGSTYFHVMKQLKPKIRYGKKWHELTKDTECHLDPDICAGIIPRCENWKPCFGQMNQAQSHLVREGVQENDLFLFFGWFKKTILKGGILHFETCAPDWHRIFGYLQIGEIVQVKDSTEIPDWMQNHPHARNEGRKKVSTNAIYTARDHLTWDTRKSGAGVFHFNDTLVLTKKGFSRSKWELPAFFKEVKISRHSEKSWKQEGYFQSVAIGQEFVVEDNENVENWAQQLIGRHG